MTRRRFTLGRSGEEAEMRNDAYRRSSDWRRRSETTSSRLSEALRVPVTPPSVLPSPAGRRIATVDGGALRFTDEKEYFDGGSQRGSQSQRVS